ncbi:MAG: hypothetical protein AW11_03268 [Candidatus Accumulibacter regalis]|jgi:Protein of unknown function (DUF3616).|uniref:DUF3616 domain-containing protein n=1 Tax=Accumulibacter regalis TaxID=522306 RepID=A0A011PEF9_ACCRE|nr:DUF3616 domain-containing protein [Accumulibacter sp.]EXI85936.1 MAG: hypothetical protein AW11_03268 [Candidatus Accumulibacter regalis]MBL8368224.1 DUF3616 domain-containing protein [Accumulibacter sp.]MBN8513366.1 DUF3616 domain-containing protein [Accumulibacter sp.]MBO3701265.1 DUF3616 domain-containing protein [Accumulibacter sp.]HRE72170.1 DUF3616 domain-containing protein [Accumulibacter sp.]
MKHSGTRFLPSWRRSALALVSASLLWAPGSTYAQTPLTIPSVQPTSGPWDSGDGFSFKLGKKKDAKIRRSVSGIACSRSAVQQRICLLVFDEGVEARYATLRDGTLVVGPERVALRADEGELDAEGAATDGNYFYVTGSHSAKRSDCRNNPHSRHVIRFRRDPATGRALRSPGGDPSGVLVDYADSGRLWSIMQAQPELQAHVGEGKCLGTTAPPEAPKLLGQHGVNIEGLAVSDGRLYFGFRGPARKGQAVILAVDSEALFQGGDVRASITRIKVGAGRGIRDMVAVQGGILLLTGPDDDPATQPGVKWAISWWDGKSSSGVVTPKTLATLDLGGVELREIKAGKANVCEDKELKPEAMTVLDETPQAYRLLILSDGMCDGGALTFSVPR